MTPGIPKVLRLNASPAMLVIRIFGSAAILTAESKTTSLRNGKTTDARVRLVAVYAQEGDAIRLVHFQSTMLPAETSATPNEAP